MSGNDLLFVLRYYNLSQGNDVNENFKIVCPFHGDINASLSINLETGWYYCFGCEAKGDAVKFVQEMEGCNSLKACMILKKILAGSADQYVNVKRETKKTKSEHLKEAKRYFYSLPMTDWREIRGSYLQKRGFTGRVLTEVDCRINYNEDYGIIFPMKDMGRFRGYVCRTTKPEVEAKRKYLYSKGFSRRDTLVGYYNRPWVVIVEGYMDWLKFRQYGVKNCCAILGWRITSEQIEKLQEHTDCVISALDNTETGQQGTKLLSKHFEVVPFQYMTGLKDPGDMDRMSFNFSWADTLRKVMKADRAIEKDNWR